MSSDKAKRKAGKNETSAKSRRPQTTRLKDLGPRKRRTQEVTGGAGGIMVGLMDGSVRKN